MSRRTENVGTRAPRACAHAIHQPQGPICHRLELMGRLHRWVPVTIEGKAIVAVLGGHRLAARRACGLTVNDPLPPRKSTAGRRFLALVLRYSRWELGPVVADEPQEMRMPCAASICELVSLLTDNERAVYLAMLERWEQ